MKKYPTDLSNGQWQTVYYYFNRWRHLRVIEKIQGTLVKQIRVKQGKRTKNKEL